MITPERTPTPTTRRGRLRRWAQAYAGPDTTKRADSHAPNLLAMALWFGLLASLLEVGLLVGLKPWHDPTPGFFRMNRNLLWMVPVLNLGAFAVLASLLGLAARLRGRSNLRLRASLLAFLAALTLALSFRSLYPLACLILAAGCAVQIGRWAAAHAALFQRLVRWSLPPLFVLQAVVLAASIGRECLAEQRALAALPAAPAGSPNVLLIVLDTVRADHLSLYGYHRDTTPNLERLAQRGVRFDRARSPAPWTLPAHASLFTGRWPHELSAGVEGPLDATYPTLAAFLRDRGYLTGGFVANTIYCTAETGLSRGFIHYEDHDRTPATILNNTALGQRALKRLLSPLRPWLDRHTPNFWIAPSDNRKDAARINRDFLAWLSRHEGRPFFAFLNYFDAHHPYEPPAEARHHFGLKPESDADHRVLRDWWLLDKQTLPERTIELARDAYDDCIAYLDGELGRLFEELEQRGLLEDTLIIVTSDHGELFGEHDLFCHGASVYDPEVHVPLLLVWPAAVPRGERVSQPVSLRDLPATITGLLGFGADSPFPGRSLARFWDQNAPSYPTSDPVLCEVQAPQRFTANQGRSPVCLGSVAAVADGALVLIRNGDGREELYDVETDPEQRDDLTALAPPHPALEPLRQALRSLLAD